MLLNALVAKNHQLQHAAIKFHPHGDMSTPACWMNPDESCGNSR